MNNNNGALQFDAVIHNTDFKKQLDDMSRRIRGLSETTVRETERMDAGFSKLGIAIGGVLSITAAKQFISDLVNVRGEFQQLEIAFNTMLGSKQRADELMAQIVRTAAITPFNLTEVAQGAKQLIAYGTAAEEVNDTLNRLGNIASGLSLPLNDLIYLYGTTQVQGRLFAQDVRQFMGRGIPLVQELAKEFGKTSEEINQMVTDGKIGFPEVQKVIKGMTDEGGMFFNLMEQQSKSLTGQIANLGDAWDIMLNEIGAANDGVLSGSIEMAAKLVENYESVGKVLVALIATYGAYRAALLTANVLNGTLAISTGVYSVATRQLVISQTAAATAQAALNRVMLANPYVMIATAVTGLAAALWYFHDGATAAEKAQRRLNEILEESRSVRENLSGEISKLNSIIQDEASSTLQRVTAYERLQQMFPEILSSLSLQEYQTRNATEQQKKFNESLDGIDVKRIESELEKAKLAVEEWQKVLNTIGSDQPTRKDNTVRRLEEARANAQLLEEELSNVKRRIEEATEAEKVKAMTTEQQLQYYKQIEREIKAHQSEIETTILLARKGTAEFKLWELTLSGIRLDRLNNDLSEIQKKINDLKPKETVRNKSFYEAQKKAATERFESALPNTDAYVQAKKDIEAADKALKNWDTTTKTVKPKKIDVILPSGSLAEIERQIQKAEDVLSKIPTTQTERIKAMHETLRRLHEQRVEAEKAVEFRTWDEVIDYKRQSYVEFEKAQENELFPGMAKALYAGLLKDGKTYVEFLQKQLIPLQEKASEAGIGSMSASELHKALRLKNESDTAFGKTTPIEDFKKRLDESRNSVLSLTEYLSLLKSELESLNGDTTGFGLARKKILNDEVRQTETEIKDFYTRLINEAQTYEKKKKAITNTYDVAIAEARKKYVGEDQKQVVKNLKQRRDLEIDHLAEETIARQEAYNNIKNQVLINGRALLKARIDDIRKELAESNEAEEIKTKKRRELQRAEAQLMVGDIRSVADIISQNFGNVSIEIAKGVKITGQQIAQFTNNIAGIFDTRAGTSGQVSSWIGAINQAVLLVRDMIVATKPSLLRSNMEDQNDYYNDLTSSISGVNLLLQRQAELLDGMYGEQRITAMMDYYNRLTSEREKAYKMLRDFQLNIITDEQETLVDPIFGINSKNDTLGKIRNLLNAGGQALTRMDFEFGNVDTSQFKTLDDWINLLAEIKSNKGTINGFKVPQADIDSLEYIINLIREYEKEESQLAQTINEIFTGTTVDIIADSIVQGFQQGKRSAEDFAGDFESMMQKALINSFKVKITDQLLYDFYQRFSQLAGPESDMMLTEQEIAELKKMFADKIENAALLWDQFQQITGKDLAGMQDALQGAIKGVTEDTASVIAGQMNAIRINQAETQNIMREQLMQLSNIAANTRYNYHLEAIEGHLRRMQSQNGWRDVGVSQ